MCGSLSPYHPSRDAQGIRSFSTQRVPLSAQAFAAPTKLTEMVVRVNEALVTQLPAAVKRMQLYLTNPSTHAILFKPVKVNIAGGCNQSQ